VNDCLCNSNEEQLVVIPTEDMGEIECRVMFIFEAKGFENKYAALAPKNSDEDVFIYRYDSYKDGNYNFSNIDSDEEYLAAVEAFEQIAEEEDIYFDEDDEFVYDDD